MNIPHCRGQYTPGVITGKPVGGGGSLGRTEATGYGVVYHIREAMKHLKMDSSKCSVCHPGIRKRCAVRRNWIR